MQNSETKLMFDKYKILHSLLALYILCSGFEDALAISPKINMSLFLVIAILLHLLFGMKKIKLFKPDATDLMLFLFLVVVYVSYISNGIYMGFHAKAFNHLIAYSFSIILLYFTVKFAFQQMFCQNENYFQKIIAWFYYVTFMIAVYAVIEFILINVFGIFIDNFVPGITENFNAMAVGRYIRARGTLAEPGTLAFFLELFVPVGCYYCFCTNNTIKKRIKWLYGLFVLTAFALTFSTIGYVIFFLMLAFFIPKMKIKKQYFALFFIICLILGLLYYNTISEIISKTIIDKFSSNSFSFTDRTERLATVFDVFSEGSFMQKMIGFGPAAYDAMQINSAIGLYHNTLLESGILGLFLLFLAFFSVFLSILSIADKRIRCMFLISFIAGIIHSMALTPYYRPWLWIIIGLASIAKPFINKYNNTTTNTL